MPAYLIFIIPPILIISGIFLACFKRKPAPGVDPLAWIDKLDLPESAKNVRRKEASKQTARMLSLAWVLEYWRGQRSAFAAFLCWKLILPITLLIIFAIGAVTLALTQTADPEAFAGWLNSGQLAAIAILIVVKSYFIFSDVIWWKCANNSKTYTKYLIKFIAGLGVAGAVIGIVSLFI